jgi:hypothetical protein
MFLWLLWKDRYKAFGRMIREWRHLQMLKRAGRGNDSNLPVEKTGLGELAIRCPACPWEGVNLPDNWAEVDDSEKYVLV